ncbi:MAG: hypothetical protein U9N19_10520 [Thermodesulfobacteriota bacterium]|nr:hypothetical protein [Thermodesulfobacteriota bacterium]
MFYRYPQKKNLLIIAAGLLVLFFHLSVHADQSSCIIDHTCTDISQVPACWIAKAKAEFKISYGHTSHGSQLVTGMELLRTQSDLYSFNYDGNSGALSLHDRKPSGDLGNPDRTTWAQRTRDLLNATGNDINLIMWSWCGQVSIAGEKDIATYLTLMNQLEADYPDVTFVYMTGHLNGTGEGGDLNIRNNQIRNYCAANNKILFDFADIESYDPAGNYFLDRGATDSCNYKDGNWADEWCTTHPDECSSCSCAHSHCLNCQLKGRAFWWMMARLAGWNPSPLLVTPTIFLTTEGRSISTSWDSVADADGYILFYASYPDVSYIGSADMDNHTNLSLDMWPGAAFYLVV